MRSLPTPTEQHRLREVAQVFLGRERPRGRCIAVAGPDDPVTPRRAHRALARAAAGLGIAVRCEGEPAARAQSPLVLLEHGAVDEDRLQALSASPAPPCDLLLWTLPPGRPLTLRGLYLLGVWSWAHRPRHVRCLLHGRVSAPATHAADIESALTLAGLPRRSEVLQVETERDWEPMMGQILQSALSAPAPRRRRNPPRALLPLLLLAALLLPTAPSLAQERPVALELHGVAPEGPWGTVLPDGGRLLVGPRSSVRLGRGVGAWAADSTALFLPARPDELELRVGVERLSWVDGDYGLPQPLTAVGPGFEVVVWEGRLEIEGRRLRIWVKRGAGAGDLRQGWWITGALFVLIVFLFWRASAMRRRLDRPRVSLRQRASRD